MKYCIIGWKEKCERVDTKRDKGLRQVPDFQWARSMRMQESPMPTINARKDAVFERQQRSLEGELK